jgi:hypothetical protein
MIGVIRDVAVLVASSLCDHSRFNKLSESSDMIALMFFHQLSLRTSGVDCTSLVVSRLKRSSNTRFAYP